MNIHMRGEPGRIVAVGGSVKDKWTLPPHPEDELPIPRHSVGSESKDATPLLPLNGDTEDAVSFSGENDVIPGARSSTKAGDHTSKRTSSLASYTNPRDSGTSTILGIKASSDESIRKRVSHNHAFATLVGHGSHHSLHPPSRILSLGEALPLKLPAGSEFEDFRLWLAKYLEDRLEDHRVKTCDEIKVQLDLMEASLHGSWLPSLSGMQTREFNQTSPGQSGKWQTPLKCQNSGLITPRSLPSEPARSVGALSMTPIGSSPGNYSNPIYNFLHGVEKPLSVAGVYSLASTPPRASDNSDSDEARSTVIGSRVNSRVGSVKGNSLHARISYASAQWFNVVRTERSDDVQMKKIRETIASNRAPEIQRRGWLANAIWDFLENPFSSNLAWYYSIFVPMFVVASVTVSVMQAIPNFPLVGTADTMVQTGVESLFAVELILRFSVCPNRWKFWLSFFNYVDIISTAPVSLRLYVLFSEASGRDAKSARHMLTGLAAVPVLRLLKVTRRFEKFQLLLAAFQIAFEALPVLLYTMMLICLIFSALIFAVERDTEIGSDAGESLPEAMWFVIVTMTTVGYGDITPVTPLGHVITCSLMVVSALYMAMPIGIVGNAFSQVWGDRDRLLLMQRLRDAFLQGGFTPAGIKSIMHTFDQDGSGELDVDEFQVMLKSMHIHMGEQRIYKLFHILDQQKQGVINVEDFMRGMFPNCVAAMRKSVERNSMQTPPKDVAKA